MDHLSEAQFVGRIFLRLDQRFLGAGVIHFDQQQSGLDPGHIQRQHSSGVDVELLALFHHRVPDFDRVVPRHPYFVAEVAGVSGARDVDENVADLAARHAEIFEIGDVRFRNRFEQLARGRSLQRQCGKLFGNVFDLNVHVQAVLPEPAQAGIGGGPAILVVFEARDGAVVDDFSLLVAPAAINYLAHSHLGDVARDDAVHQLGGVLARDQILVERRDVDERGRIADGVVLVLVMHFVHADGVVSRPLAVIKTLAKRKSSLVKCGSNWQREAPSNLCVLRVLCGCEVFNQRGHRGHGGKPARAGLYAVFIIPGNSMKRLCLTCSHAEDRLSRQRLPFQLQSFRSTIMRSSSSAMLSWAVLKSGL